MKGAILLCSGGLDSVVLAHYLKNLKKIDDLRLIFFNYGQKSIKEELFCVKKLAKKLGCNLDTVNIDWLGKISTSLINKNSENQNAINLKNNEELLSWYVPGRNAVFLLMASSLAESEFIRNNKAYDVYIGIKHEGELRFKDTTKEFITQINKALSSYAQDAKIRIMAPFIDKDKEELISVAKKVRLDLKDTYSCYTGKGFVKNIPMHCGICGGCRSRKKAFKFSNTEDPSIYA